MESDIFDIMENKTYREILISSISISNEFIPDENIKGLKNDIVEALIHRPKVCLHHYFGRSVYPGETYCSENSCTECWDRKYGS